MCDSIQQSRIDTKKGVLYRLNNLPSTHASEEKEPESDNAKEGETQPSTSVDASERTDVPDKSVEEGDGKKEEKESIEEEEKRRRSPKKRRRKRKMTAFLMRFLNRI